MSHPPEFPLRIFFDGACPLCSREIEHYRRQDRAGRLVPVDISAPGFDPGLYGMPLQAFMSELHAIDRSGNTYRGVEAFAAIWQAFPDRIGYRLLAKSVSLPGIRMLARIGYRWFARVRPRLPRGERAAVRQGGADLQRPGRDERGANR